MAKHAPELMRPETFALSTELNKRRVAFWVAHPGKVHPLRELHGMLQRYWGLPKQMLQPRHALMRDIVRQGNAYLRSKSPKKSNSDKVQTVSVLVWQANVRLSVEENRARLLEKKVNTDTRHVNVVGGHGRGQRFERVASPGGLAVVGADLYREAEAGVLGNIELTGNDLNDLYALKKLLKTLTPEQMQRAGLKPLEYCDEDMRAGYALHVGKKKVTWDSTHMPVDTMTCVQGDPPNTGLYAADLAGNFYCRVYDQTDANRGFFAHSSFLAGNEALCAGTVKIKYGRLLEISNMSGHYMPRRAHLADACAAILEHGYDPADDAYALLYDAKMEYPITSAKNTSFYRFPLKLFAESAGTVANHLDFEVIPPARGSDGRCTYTNPQAARKRGAVPE